MQGSELPIDSTDAFDQMSNLDINQVSTINYSINSSHDFHCLSDEIDSAVSFKVEEQSDAEVQEQRLNRSLCSIENSADLEPGGTVTLKNGISCNSAAVNYSDFLIATPRKNLITHSSKRKNYLPVKYGTIAKRLKSNFAGSKSDAAALKFETPCFPESPMQKEVLVHESIACTNIAGPSLTKLNETDDLSATSSNFDQANNRVTAFPMILLKISSLLDNLNRDRNEISPPNGGIAENFGSSLSSLFSFLSSLHSLLLPLVALKNSGNFEDAPLVNSNFGSGRKTIGPFQMSPIHRELLDEATSYNMPAPHSLFSTNPLSQSIMTSTDADWQEELKRIFANMSVLMAANHENVSPNKVPNGLSTCSPFITEPRPSGVEQIFNPDARQQPTRSRRKRRRRPSQYVCNLCNESFLRVSELNFHTVSKHGCYRCHLCNAKFTQRSNLQRHEPIHSGERPYKCLRCLKDYLRADHLKRHMNRNHAGYDPISDTLILKNALECLICSKNSEGNVDSDDSKKKAAVLTPSQSSFREISGPGLTLHALEVQETGKVTDIGDSGTTGFSIQRNENKQITCGFPLA
ncbi:hypothetical protein Aperf_G00000066152 [Anoplocephala perfoliata]